MLLKNIIIVLSLCSILHHQVKAQVVDLGETQGLVIPIGDTLLIENPTPGQMVLMPTSYPPDSLCPPHCGYTMFTYNGDLWFDMSQVNGLTLGEWSLSDDVEDGIQLTHKASGFTGMQLIPTLGDTMSIVMGGPGNSVDAEESLSRACCKVEGATVSGGSNNRATGRFSTVTGGKSNRATNFGAVVLGGVRDTASGRFSTVTSGFLNKAAGTNSFAHGRNAHALHAGSYVWNGSEIFDFTNTDKFSSTSTKQYLINADGGVGIGTNAPTSQLTVLGNIEIDGTNNGLEFPDGSIQKTAAITTTGEWKVIGNGGTGGAGVLGTTDNFGFELVANNRHAFSFFPAVNSSDAPNLVGGYEGNTTLAQGATISGGGNEDGPNTIIGDYGTIGGGADNTGSFYATVGGGRDNTTNNEYSTIAGGSENVAISNHATVGGGQGNQAHGQGSTIGGGVSNAVLGQHAAVPGGQGNLATGDNSFAAGTNAESAHNGSFTWSDFSTPMMGFTSTTENEFNVKAAGGTRIFSDAGASTGVLLTPGSGSWVSASSIHLKTDFENIEGENILSKLNQLKIRKWRYKTEESNISHIGPTSQDFRKAFGLGATDEGISTVDADGVALAAIKELYLLVQKQANEIEELKSIIKNKK